MTLYRQKTRDGVCSFYNFIPFTILIVSPFMFIQENRLEASSNLSLRKLQLFVPSLSYGERNHQ